MAVLAAQLAPNGTHAELERVLKGESILSLAVRYADEVADVLLLQRCLVTLGALVALGGQVLEEITDGVGGWPTGIYFVVYGIQQA